MNTKERIFSLITKENQTTNRIINKYIEKFDESLNPYKAKMFLNELKLENKIIEEKGKDGWRVYWRLR